MAERLETYAIYVCRGSISRIENHERTVTDFELRALAEVLEVDVVDLLKNRNYKYTKALILRYDAR